ncbi:hypothetical protein NXY00_11870 [Bacteroides sp. BFG-551]|nr:hypothetical protein [Bacteroides sp. BFG-551]
MSRQWGIIQFSKGNRPDSSTGYTLDDTARALMAMCQVVATGQGKVKERYVKTYLNFIRYCQQPDGSFLNYVDKDGIFTLQNEEVGLDDSNGRAVCALGYFISCAGHFPAPWKEEAEAILKRTFQRFDRIESPRSIAFMLKGFYYYSRECPSAQTDACIGCWPINWRRYIVERQKCIGDGLRHISLMIMPFCRKQCCWPIGYWQRGV